MYSIFSRRRINILQAGTQNEQTMQIGFIGVGMMGHGMAKNLVEKGFKTAVLGNKNRLPVEDLVKRGAREARDPADAAEGAEVVLLCVTGSPQVEEIVHGAKGLLGALKKGQIVSMLDDDPSSPGRFATN